MFAIVVTALLSVNCLATQVVYEAMEIFPLIKQHCHGSTIVELPNGDLLAAWFQGSG